MAKPAADGRKAASSPETRHVDLVVGRQVRLRRILLGLSQAQLASPLSVTPQQVALFERGESQLHASQLFLLARLLGTSVEFFFSPLVMEIESKRLGLVDTTMAVSRAVAEELKLDPDGRSNRELKQLVKAVSRIPRGKARSQLLQMMTGLQSVNKVTVIDPF